MPPHLPDALQELVDLFEPLQEAERRENLIAYAEMADRYAPQSDVSYSLVDERKDAECTDSVGIYLHLQADGRVHFAVALGPKIQTLTRAMTAILCRGLNGSSAAEILAVTPDFVSRIIGSELVRLRSRTVYYVLNRMQEAVKKSLSGESSLA